MFYIIVFFFVVEVNYLLVVEKMLKSGVGVNVCGLGCKMVLYIVVVQNYVEVVKFFFD